MSNNKVNIDKQRLDHLTNMAYDPEYRKAYKAKMEKYKKGEGDRPIFCHEPFKPKHRSLRHYRDNFESLGWCVVIKSLREHVYREKQEAFGERFGVSQVYISDIERGQKKPSKKFMRRFVTLVLNAEADFQKTK